MAKQEMHIFFALLFVADFAHKFVKSVMWLKVLV